MSARPSLETGLTRWFTATLVVLYAIVATAVWMSDFRSRHDFAVLTLKSEAEDVASYLAARGRLDAPELAQPEDAPFPIWLRVTRGSRVLAATPGIPEIAPSVIPDGGQVVAVRGLPGPGHYLVVRHRVGGRVGRYGPGLAVEAVGSLNDFVGTERSLAAILIGLGLVVLPIATTGGRRLGRRALAPLASLVRGIQELAPAPGPARLDVPGGAVEEVAVLADAFNDVLTRLERSVAAMMRFTADASHEIRNPLSVMRTGLEVALRRERGAGEYRQVLEENLQEVERLQSTLEGLLTMARTAPGQEPPFQHEAVDLSKLLHETAGRFHVLSAERRAPIELRVDPGLELAGDPRLLRLAIFNLLDNALKHGPEGAPVELRASRDGSEIRIRVSDLGPGIPEAQRQRIFERYYRVGGLDAAAAAGGLGLSVVRWAAEAHGGCVAVLDSERGTTFEVRLPQERAA